MLATAKLLLFFLNLAQDHVKTRVSQMLASAVQAYGYDESLCESQIDGRCAIG
jgi:hypothetical protein